VDIFQAVGCNRRVADPIHQVASGRPTNKQTALMMFFSYLKMKKLKMLKKSV